MPTEPSQFSRFLLGDLRVEPDRNVLLKGDQEFRLEPRVMDVLCTLAATPGRVVSRAELINTLWSSEFGADEALTRAISLIRKTLRAAGAPEPAIETIKKRGYRLLLPVEREGVVDSRSQPAAPETGRADAVAPPAKSGRKRRLGGLVLVIASAVTLATAAFLLREQSPAPSEALSPTAPVSVVVLPFESLSTNEGDAYFGAGIAEELLNSLARLRDLRVVGRTSAFASGNAELDPKALGERLSVDHIVTGSVRRDGVRLRISAQLLRSNDGLQVWTNRYELDAGDLFAVEDEIVLEIAQALQVRLGVGGEANRNDGRGVDPLAYEQYLQGLYFLGARMQRDDNRAKALAAFQQAVAFDPEFADAWAGVGTVAVYSVGSPLSRDRSAFRQMTEEALQRAIELDPDNPRAHAALVIFNLTQVIDVGAARQHLARAQALAPNAAPTHYATMLFHRARGDASAALAAMDRTIVLDPLDAILKLVRASVLIEMGRNEEAMAAYEDCYLTKCLGEGFVAFASAAAVFTGEAQYRERWQDRVNAFEAHIEALPASKLPIVARLMPAFTAIRYGRGDRAEQIERIRQLFEEQRITDTIGIWGPTFAEYLPEDTFMDVLHLAYERGDLFSATFALSPMYGVNPYPQWVLEHPRYRELWEKPGMRELAKEWRRAGRFDGLPRQ
ncbi:MAG: winged helix-turn-helix domain-containing protein [Pseudomonadota bacterium]